MSDYLRLNDYYYNEQPDPEGELHSQVSLLVPILKELTAGEVFEVAWAMDDEEDGIGILCDLEKKPDRIRRQYQFPSDIIVEFLRRLVDFDKMSPEEAWLEFGIGEDPYVKEAEEALTERDGC